MLTTELSAAECHCLVLTTKRFHFGPGEATVQEGAGGDCLFQVLHVHVDVSKAMEDCRQVTVCQLEPAGVFDKMGLRDDAPFSVVLRGKQIQKLVHSLMERRRLLFLYGLGG